MMIITCCLCSFYGTKTNTKYWDVVTVNFSSIFSRTCTASDFYQWQPWDARTESDCILGLDITLERRLPQRCCLIGQNYDRPISVSYCDCNIDDYEWYVLVSVSHPHSSITGYQGVALSYMKSLTSCFNHS